MTLRRRRERSDGRREHCDPETSMPVIQRFEVPGPPVPKQRPRRAPDGHFYTPAKTRQYEEAVAWQAQAARVRLEPGRVYGIRVDLHLSTRRFDCDNALKAIQDGLNRLPGFDDRQLVDLAVKVVPVRDGSEEKAVISLEDRGESYVWMKQME